MFCFWISFFTKFLLVGRLQVFLTFVILLPFIVETYNEYHRERLNAKSGITGLWQISGDRSLPIHENIDHDLFYISHQSLLLDIVIILQTIWFALIRCVGAK